MPEDQKPGEQPESRSLTNEVVIPPAQAITGGLAGGAAGAYVAQKVGQGKDRPKDK